MRKCIMVKVGEAKKRKRTKMGRFINFAELGEICIIGLGDGCPWDQHSEGLCDLDGLRDLGRPVQSGNFHGAVTRMYEVSTDGFFRP